MPFYILKLFQFNSGHEKYIPQIVQQLKALIVVKTKKASNIRSKILIFSLKLENSLTTILDFGSFGCLGT